jgi:hypothetical protein
MRTIFQRGMINGMITSEIDGHLYMLTTDDNGKASIAFEGPHEHDPGIFPVIQGGTANQSVIVESADVNGFTIRVVERATVATVSGDVMSGNTTNVSGAQVAVWIA